MAARVDATAVGAALRELVSAVRRLGPDRRDPEAFHIEKDGIARRLAALASDLENASTPMPFPAKTSKRERSRARP